MDNSNSIRCQKCGSYNTEVMFSITISAPSKFFGRISKEDFNREDIKLWHANWHNAEIICKDCGSVRSIYEENEKI